VPCRSRDASARRSDAMDDCDMPGAELSRGFYEELVAPVLAESLPGLRYAAARLGTGSDVLGLDDAISRDHDWGCRLTLLVGAADGDLVPRISDLLERRLPKDYRGRPVRFATSWDPRLATAAAPTVVRRPHRRA